MPFALVDNVAWRALFHWLNHEALLQSPQSLKRDVEELHSSLQCAANKAFQQAGTFCSIQTDVWTTAAGQLSFTAGNISWVDQEWQLHTDFGFFTPLTERHTGVNVSSGAVRVLINSWLRLLSPGSNHAVSAAMCCPLQQMALPTT